MANNKIELYDTRRDVIVMIGDLRQTEVLFGEQGNKIEGIPSFRSCELRPKLFTDPARPSLAIYHIDWLAGYQSAPNDIAKALYFSKIVQHANRLKIVAIVDYETVKPNGGCMKFAENLPMVLDSVRNIENPEGSGVFLLVNNYENPIENSIKRFHDDDVVRSFIKVLEAIRDYALNKWPELQTTILFLFQSWLQKTEDGKYPNIQFSRAITTEGKLSNLESETRRQQIRPRILDNPTFPFKSVQLERFKFPTSARTKLRVREFMRNQEHEANELLKSVELKFTKVKELVVSAGDIEELQRLVERCVVYLEELKHLMEKHGLSPESLAALRKFGNSIQAEIEEEMNKLEKIVKQTAFFSRLSGKMTRTPPEATMKNLVTEIGNVPSVIVHEAHLLLMSVVQDVMAVIMLDSTSLSGSLGLPAAFQDNLQELIEEKSGFHRRSLKILRALGVDSGTKVDKLEEFERLLQLLTKVDPEQPSAIWADANAMWNHAMESMKKDIALLKVQQDLAEVEAQRQLTAAAAEAKLAEIEMLKESILVEVAKYKAESYMDVVWYKAHLAEVATSAAKSQLNPPKTSNGHTEVWDCEACYNHFEPTHATLGKRKQ